MSNILFVHVLTLFLSFIPEHFLNPKPSRKAYKARSLILHVLTLSAVFIVVLLLLQRPYFASIFTLVTLSVFVVVSNAKFKTLREPLVYSDIAMFSQAFKHPRLYFPFLGFLGVAPVVLVPLVIGSFIFLMIKYEIAIKLSLLFVLVSVLVIIAILYFIKRISLQLTLMQQPSADIEQYGLIASLWAYAYQARTPQYKSQINKVVQSSIMNKQVVVNESKPNILVIQSESFFDARRLHPSINPTILDGFDQLCNEAIAHGQLKVPAWGANTMRTEFSFLTGINADELGLYRFYPYYYLADQKIPSLASYYRQQGYHCVCIHPHAASFFKRNTLFVNMGFDAFIDIDDFDSKDTFGPYISDAAVTKKISEVLAEKIPEKPVFVFVITMENHGPLHLEKVEEKEAKQYYSNRSFDQHNDLAVYLRHIINANTMFHNIRELLDKSKEEYKLCIYGDHIPSMPEIYKILGYENDNTDYLIWTNTATKKSNSRSAVAVEDLAMLMIKS